MTLWATTWVHNRSRSARWFNERHLLDAGHRQTSQRPEEGQVLLILVLLLGVLIALVGLAVDGAVLYVVQGKLQPAADAAALAAVEALPQRDAIQEAAELYIRLNDLPPDTEVYIAVGPASVQESNQVTVTLTQNVPLSFLAILDVQTAQVTVSAAASRASTAADLMLALDSSRCNKTGLGWLCSEIREGAWSLAQAVLDQGGRIGIVDYRRTARLLLSPTTDRKEVQQTLQTWGTGAEPTKENNLGDGLWLAAWKLAGLSAERPQGVLILAADEINVGRNCCVECKCDSEGLSVCDKKCSSERCCARWGREAAVYAQKEGLFVLALDGSGSKDGTQLLQDIASGPPTSSLSKSDANDPGEAGNYYVLVGDRVGKSPQKGDFLAAFAEALNRLPGGEGAQLVR